MEDEIKKESAAESAAETVHEEAEPKKKARRSPPKVKEIDPSQIVSVRNGFQGRLVYKSRHTGEKYVWDEFGAEQDMELSELRNARSSAKKFFINNWFMFDEQWVIDYLGMGQYYKHTVAIDDFDELFTLPAEELAAKLELIPDGQKRSVAYRARQLIAEGGIDSNKVIGVLEECLKTELVEK